MMIVIIIFLLVMSVLRIFAIEVLVDFFPGFGMTLEELNEWRGRVILPSLFLTCAYFILRYFRGKNPTSAVWPVYVVGASSSFVQAIALFTMAKISTAMIITFLTTFIVTVLLRVAHNKRQKEISTF
jgi:uncharacterized BrkB/YihY/UPF0761 family membrane protein